MHNAKGQTGQIWMAGDGGEIAFKKAEMARKTPYTKRLMHEVRVRTADERTDKKAIARNSTGAFAV